MRSFYAYCLHKLHRHLGFRLYQIRVRALHDSGVDRLDAGGLRLRRATREEVLAAAADPALELEPAVAEHALARGDRCDAAFDRQRLVAYSWCSLQSTPVDEHLRVALPPRAVYRYKSFVLPGYRGRRLLAALNRLSEREFIAAGKTTCASYVDSHNFAMLHASARAGYRRAGFIALTEHPHRFRCWRSPGARALGLSFVERGGG